jgi:conjugative transfer signal peptidase TraF
MKRRPQNTLVLSTISIALLALSVRTNMPLFLLFNPTESAPRGWYSVRPATDVHVDDFVVVRLPSAVAQLAADRGYLPHSVPLLKHVAAITGQTVCVRNGFVFIDQTLVASTRMHDGAGRALIAWSQCRILARDELFLLSRDSDASFDSRYFGPVTRSRIYGHAKPLWTW